jgi:hypothetical protein
VTEAELRRAGELTDERVRVDAALEANGQAIQGYLSLLEPGIARHGVNGNGPRSGDGPWQNPFHELLSTLHSGPRGLESTVWADELIHPPAPQAATTVSPASGVTVPSFEVTGIVASAFDERWLIDHLVQARVEVGDLGVQEFKQTGARTLTGAIERDPLSVEPKAALSLGLKVEQVPLKQEAVVIDKVPSELFPAVQGLGDNAPLTGGATEGGLMLGWLTSEGGKQVKIGIESHIVAAITAVKPAFSETGVGKLAQIRNAVSAHRALGAQPAVLAATPKYCAELDSLEDANKRPIFPLGVVGGSSPLFGLTVVELRSEEHDPLLIDPRIAGIFYSSEAKLLVDPFSEMKSNLVNVRLEMNVLFHCRDVAGFYSVGKVAWK